MRVVFYSGPGKVIIFQNGEKDMGNRVSKGRHFILHRDPSDKWLTWSPPLPLGKFNPEQKTIEIENEQDKQ